MLLPIQTRLILVFDHLNLQNQLKSRNKILSTQIPAAQPKK